MADNGSPVPVFESDEDRTYYLVRFPVNPKAVVEQEVATHQVTHQVESLIMALDGEMNRTDIMEILHLRDRVNFRRKYIEPALKSGFIEMTQPDSSNSPTQKYRLTAKGMALLKTLKK